MSDDEVDQDLLSFMRAHLDGGHLIASEATIGVLESAEYIYDVPDSALLTLDSMNWPITVECHRRFNKP
jgi:hypothetical protein